jgi:hypothetical protein
MAKKTTTSSTTSREMALMYLVTFGVNAAVLYAANMMFPKNVVLGNMSLSAPWAILLSSGALAVFSILAVPVIEYAQEKMGPFSMTHWILGYLVINFAGIWLVSRYAEQFGFGISAWWVGLILAGITDFLQGFGSTIVYSGKK